MVFSFFKKQPQKMPERKAARPRAPEPRPEVRVPPPQFEDIEPLAEPLPDLEFTTTNLSPVGSASQSSASPATKKKPAADDLDFTDAEFDLEFTESSVMAIDVDDGGDPVQGEIEQVVVLFANGQDKIARSLLENLVRSYPGEEGRRFWPLLFDLLQVTGDRAAFDKLCVEYAETCETSPPVWRQKQAATVPNGLGAKVFVLQGVLTAEGAQPVSELEKLIGQKIAVSVDCGKLIGCDDEVAGQLARMLTLARRKGMAVSVENVEGVRKRLDERLVVGDPKNEPAWLLLLELLQRTGTQEKFEERAVDYAVTFELSPPSWETPPKKGGKAAAAVAPVARDDAYALSGELKNARFDELVAVFETHEQPVFDFSGVSRMDFFSAGQLVNRLSPYKKAGRDIVIRSPNHLVAELMAVVGLNKIARIIIPKL